MEIAIILMVLGAVVAFILAPLFRTDAALPETGGDDRALADALSRRDSTYEAMADLDDDHAAGKLSQEDYAEMKRAYQRDAVAALRDLDQLEGGREKLDPR